MALKVHKWIQDPGKVYFGGSRGGWGWVRWLDRFASLQPDKVGVGGRVIQRKEGEIRT